MKIINDEYNIIIFLNKTNYKNLDFNDKFELEEYLKNLFLKLKSIYNIIICGYYIIDIYIDNNYGILMELTKEELEYFDYYDDQVDMRIVIHDNIKFLYEINDILTINKSIKNISEIYYYDNKYYIKIIKNIDFYKMGYIMEQCNSIYIEENNDINEKFNLIKI